MRLLVVSLVLFAAAVSAAAGSPAPTAGCESIVDPTGSFEWRPKRVVLGVVAVPPAYVPQTEPTGGRRWPYSSKAGVVVRADSPPVLVSVPRAWRSRVAIGWGDAVGASVLRFASCPPSSSLGDWNPYAGGFYLSSRAACFPLEFRVAGRRALVRFGVGKRCG